MAEMKVRFIRVDDELWDKAMIRARAERTNLSALIRKWLYDYANHRDETEDNSEMLLIAKQLSTFRDELTHTVQRLADLAKRMRR